MKLILNSFFLLIFFTCSSAFADIFSKKYIIYTSGIKIGDLSWIVKINNNNYSNDIKLESGGLLSTLYVFEGSYTSSGNINKNILTPNKYSHSWKTSKVNKTMELVFNNNKLKSLEQNPIEKENLHFLSSYNHLNDIFSISQQSGVAYWGIEENNIGHTMRSILIDKNLKLIKTYDGIDWKPSEAKKDIDNLLKIYY